jgi:predicted ribosomally synthesized peptide with SipW-like signal peptide
MSNEVAPRHRTAGPVEHRERRRVLGSRRIRALLSLGIVVGLGAVGTLAYWTDDATITSSSFSTGTLDVALNDGLIGPANNGGTISDTTFTLSDMIPGESFARTVKVGNAGSVRLNYTAKAWNSGTLASGLRWTVVAGSTASNSGSTAAGNRTGACSVGTTTATDVTLGTTSGTATTVIATKRPINVTSFENVCVIAKVDSAAGNALQGTSASATLIFNGTQIGAP